ncbi:MAG: hypothetical protein ABI597_01695 [Gammaproteobacteria bacterium]
MKFNKITCVFIATTFTSISLTPLAIAEVVHHPAAVVAHPHATEATKTVTHEAAIVKTKTTTRVTVEKTESKSKTIDSAKHLPLKATPTAATDVHQLKPSTSAVKNSVNSLFTNRKIKSLTGYQIINLSHDPSIKGQEAAMVAALVVKVNTAAGPKDVTYTEAELLKKFSDTSSGFYDSYLNALNKINQTKALPGNQELWGPKEITANTKIYQGNAGDCFFLSAINGILKTPGGSVQIKNMIQKIPGESNQYKVTFPIPQKFPNMTQAQLKEYQKALAASQPVIVTLTAAEIGMYSHLEKGGKWLAILSVAEAQKLHKLHLDPEATMGGGNPVQTLGLFTGKNYVQYHVPLTTPTADEQKTIIFKIRNAERHSMPIAIETDDHVLAILGYKNGNVIIKNPWGAKGWYNPKTGGWSLSNAGAGYYQMKDDGIIEVPLDQISRASTGFYDIIYHPEDEGTPKAS